MPVGTWISVPNFTAIHPINVKTFHSKPQVETSWWRYRKCQGIAKLIRILHHVTINVSTKFHGKPFNSCWDIWTKVVGWPPDQPPDRCCNLTNYISFNLGQQCTEWGRTGRDFITIPLFVESYTSDNLRSTLFFFTCFQLNLTKSLWTQHLQLWGNGQFLYNERNAIKECN